MLSFQKYWNITIIKLSRNRTTKYNRYIDVLAFYKSLSTLKIFITYRFYFILDNFYFSGKKKTIRTIRGSDIIYYITLKFEFSDMSTNSKNI